MSQRADSFHRERRKEFRILAAAVEAGKSQRQVAAEVGVGQATVSRPRKAIGPCAFATSRRS